MTLSILTPEDSKKLLKDFSRQSDEEIRNLINKCNDMSNTKSRQYQQKINESRKLADSIKKEVERGTSYETLKIMKTKLEKINFKLHR